MLNFISSAPTISLCCEPIAHWGITHRAVFPEQEGDAVQFFRRGPLPIQRQNLCPDPCSFPGFSRFWLRGIKSEKSKNNGVKLHGYYICKPFLQRGTEGLGAVMADSEHQFCIHRKQANDLVWLLGFLSSCKKIPGGTLVMGRLGCFGLTVVYPGCRVAAQGREMCHLCPPTVLPKEPFWLSEAQFQTASFPSVCCHSVGLSLTSKSQKCCFKMFWLFLTVFGYEVSLQIFRASASGLHAFHFQLEDFRAQSGIHHSGCSLKWNLYLSRIHPHQISLPSPLDLHADPAALMLQHWGIYKTRYFFPSKKTWANHLLW